MAKGPKKKKKNRGRNRNRGKGAPTTQSAQAASTDSGADASAVAASPTAGPAPQAKPETPQASSAPAKKPGGPPRKTPPAGGGDGDSWYYKRQRGTIVRWASAGVIYFLVVFGLHSLFVSVNSMSTASGGGWWISSLLDIPIPIYDDTLEITIGLLVCIGLAVLGAYGSMWLFWRQPRVSEFMIDTETEMRKVSWPSWPELKRSTGATVVAVFILGMYLFLVDMVLGKFFWLIIKS